MGLFKSKVNNNKDDENNAKFDQQSSSVLNSHVHLLKTNRKRSCFGFSNFVRRKRTCMKKKVLILGLDGVGKTNFFTRLTHPQRRRQEIAYSLSKPTVGYNVDTIKLFSRRHYYKITLWDCGGQASVRSVWSYHFSNTSLLIWLINSYDRSRLDMNLHLLSQILTNSAFYRVPVLIILYENPFYIQDEHSSDNDNNLLTNLEVAFRFLATLSSSRASTFKWQVINVNFNDNFHRDKKKVRQTFKELMEL